MRTKGSKGTAILLINRADNSIIEKFDSIILASQMTGVPKSTIGSQAKTKGGVLYKEKCFVYEKDYKRGLINFNKNQRKYNIREHGREVVMIDKKTKKVIEEFVTTGIASIKTGVPQPTISCQCIKQSDSKGRDFYFRYKSDYKDVEMDNKENVVEIENKVEIIKRKTKEYYVNVLVGLANNTLEDGAVYKINGSDLVYSKENEALMVGNVKMFTRVGMYEEVEVELPLLIEKERLFLKNLLKAFSNVKGIRKCNDIRNGFEFIRIETMLPSENIDLPAFIENKYYSNLMLDRLYSVDELGLV